MPRFKIQIQTNPTQVRVLANIHPVQAAGQRSTYQDKNGKEIGNFVKNISFVSIIHKYLVQTIMRLMIDLQS